MSHFKLISSTKASDVIPVNKYVSEKTGITVVIGEVEGPLVNGFFCFATEAHDDDGLPHTLEHLIFLGSKRYPYKGILDLLANRCMAHGTNAWTDTDHTCYTVYTAGDEGMLTLLPIYLDHILFPTLTDQGFITEVHHIDGDGNDAGVVYCEMQGRENSADSRCQLKLLRAMYPDNGYSSETGGIMKNLRESTDNTKVRDFHKKFYRPENLMIILTGQINAQDVFKSLEVVEDDIIARRANESVEDWVRPWQDIPPPPLLGELREYWPADTEDCGQVVLGWRGPVLREAGAARALTAAATLLRYLCDTAAAPLQRCLVQREDARAGDVSYNLVENMATLIKIELDNVPVGKLDLAKDEALQCLKSLRDGNEPIDMDRINRLLKKELRESKASLESDPHHVVAFRSIGDALYSQNEQDFISRMNPQEDITSLMSEPAEYWAGILRRYFTDRPVCVLGSPSVALQDRMAEEEKNRIEEQRKSLGTSGLEEKKKALQEAIEFNERPPPSGTLSSVGIPSCDNLKCHALASWATGSDCPHMDVQRLPIYARVHSLKTNFVYISVLLDTSTMEEWMRKWIPLHVNGLAECAVLREGKIIPHEQVITTTEELTASFSVAVGFGKSASFSVGSFGHFIHIDTRCEPEDYEKVVNHLYEILFTAQITKERLLVFVQRLINDVAHLRRDGHKMVYDSLRDFVYIHNSNNHWCSVLRQHTFLKQLLESLTAGGESAQTVLNRAIDTYKALTNHLWLHLATDFDRYKLSAEPWMKFAPENAIAQPPQLYSERSLMQPRTGGFVAGVGGLESSFLAQFSPGPDSPAPHTLAPLLVAINYFTQLEGPMWRLIRGSGLSYGYGVRAAPGEGRLVFLLYRAANTLAAYNVAMDILVGFEKEPVFEEDLFASAKSTALFEVVENEKCPADVVRHSLINYLQGVEHDYNRRLVSAVSAVSGAAAVAAARRWLPALAADTACLAVVCHPAKVKDMQADFLKAGVKLEAFESLENSHFNK